jgi:hypothetical protein
MPIRSALTLFLVVSQGLFSATYWIAPKAGRAQDGSERNPYGSANRALSEHGGGHTYIFKPGIYSELIHVVDRYKGTPQKPTVLKSQIPYKAVLHGSAEHNIYVRENCDWVVIDGFESSGARMDGIKANGNYGVIRNCWIHNNSGQGIGAHNVTGTVIERNLIEFNGFHIHYVHGIYGSGRNITVRQNIIRCNAGYGIHLAGETAEALIENNLVYGNYGAGILLYSHEGGGKNQILHNTVVENGFALQLKNASGETIANNIFAWNNKRTDVSGILYQGTSDLKKIHYTHNIFYPDNPVADANNLNVDPQFEKLSQKVFFLKPTSPAIKKADNRYGSKNDFFSRSRRPDGSDIGCFEYAPGLSQSGSREKWYYGWPFYSAYGDGLPDLWAVPED